MKRLFTVLALITFCIPVVVSADTYVNGYYRKDGTYVQPHYRSDRNGTKTDNWSTRGNINPYTGKRGTKNPYDTSSSSDNSSSGSYGYDSSDDTDD